MSEEVSKKNKNLTILIGKFEDATVFCGNKLINASIESEDFQKSIHEVTSGKHIYRFINPENLSERSIDRLSQDPNCVCFTGDLTGLMFNISKQGISSEKLELPEFIN